MKVAFGLKAHSGWAALVVVGKQGDELAQCSSGHRCRIGILTKSSLFTSACIGDNLVKQVAGLGKSVGPPWGKDQKEAALAALMVLSN